MFDEIQRNKDIELVRNSTKSLLQADGNVLEQFGNSRLQFQIDSTPFDKQVAVASISDDVLLGLDFGTMDVHVLSSEHTVVINQHTFPAIIVPATEIRQVKAKETVDIPAMSEAIIHVEIEKTDNIDSQIVIIEPDEQLVDKYSALMAASLVNTSDNHTSQVRIMNPGCDSIKIMCSTCIGHAEECNEKEVYTVLDQEDVEETKNYDAVKRLRFGSDSTVQAIQSQENALLHLGEM